jgi:hypothetical protein
MKHGDVRASMLRVADQYEELAGKAARRQIAKEPNIARPISP